MSDATECADGDLCTLNDVCAEGICDPGAVRDCDDGLSCTADSCDSASGDCENLITEGCVIDGACVGEGQGKDDTVGFDDQTLPRLRAGL